MVLNRTRLRRLLLRRYLHRRQDLRSNSDCAANRCELLACRTCTDGVKTGTESDIDCGGSCVSGNAGKCGLGKTCNANSDCGSSTCTGGVCVRPPFDCFDGIKGSNDVNETDVDCGGSDCTNRCIIGKACLVGSDCTTGTCTAGVCAKASTGGSCLSGADCNDGVCSGGAPTASTTAVSYTTPDGPGRPSLAFRLTRRRPPRPSPSDSR